MSQTVRAISLWQPWASGMCTRKTDGIPPKLNETRHWIIEGVKFPFPLAINAAKKKYNPADWHPDFVRRVRELQLDHYMMPYGAILGVVMVTGFPKVDDIRDMLSADELLFGNYDNTCPTCAGHGCEKCKMTGQIQRYAWTTDVRQLRILKTPILTRGAQGIFNWTIPDDAEWK